MIEDMEAELTESSEIKSKTDNLEVTEQEDDDEVIPIYLNKEEETQACMKKMEMIIEKINIFEKEIRYIQLNGGQSAK